MRRRLILLLLLSFVNTLSTRVAINTSPTSSSQPAWHILTRKSVGCWTPCFQRYIVIGIFVFFEHGELCRCRTRKNKLKEKRTPPASASARQQTLFSIARLEKRKRWFNLNRSRAFYGRMREAVQLENASNNLCIYVYSCQREEKDGILGRWCQHARHDTFHFFLFFFSPIFLQKSGIASLDVQRRIENQKTWLLHRHNEQGKSCKKNVWGEFFLLYDDFLFEGTGNQMMNTSIITLSFWDSRSSLS
jgi:hypothetical protein